MSCDCKRRNWCRLLQNQALQGEGFWVFHAKVLSAIWNAAEPLAALQLALQPRSDAELSALPEAIHLTGEVSRQVGRVSE